MSLHRHYESLAHTFTALISERPEFRVWLSTCKTVHATLWLPSEVCVETTFIEWPATSRHYNWSRHVSFRLNVQPNIFLGIPLRFLNPNAHDTSGLTSCIHIIKVTFHIEHSISLATGNCHDWVPLCFLVLIKWGGPYSRLKFNIVTNPSSTLADHFLRSMHVQETSIHISVGFRDQIERQLILMQSSCNALSDRFLHASSLEHCDGPLQQVPIHHIHAWP